MPKKLYDMVKPKIKTGKKSLKSLMKVYKPKDSVAVSSVRG